MAVEFGVLLPPREAVMSGRPETAPMLAMAERAEAAGFDSVWIGDSLTARPRHEPLTLLAAVTGCTRRVRLGTAVLLPALRSPVILAHIVGTLSSASPAAVSSPKWTRRRRSSCRGSSGSERGGNGHPTGP